MSQTFFFICDTNQSFQSLLVLIDQRWIKSFESLSSINRSNERGKGAVEIYQNSSGTIVIPEVCIFEKIVHSVKNWSFF